jgi:hypothetical protein
MPAVAIDKTFIRNHLRRIVGPLLQRAEANLVPSLCERESEQVETGNG